MGKTTPTVTYGKTYDATEHKITVWCEDITGKTKGVHRSAYAIGLNALDVAQEIIGRTKPTFSYLSGTLLDTGYPVIYTPTHLVYLHSFEVQYVFSSFTQPIKLVAIPIESDCGLPYYEMETTWNNVQKDAPTLVREKIVRSNYANNLINAIYGWIAETENYRIFANRFVFPAYRGANG